MQSDRPPSSRALAKRWLELPRSYPDLLLWESDRSSHSIGFLAMVARVLYLQEQSGRQGECSNDV